MADQDKNVSKDYIFYKHNNAALNTVNKWFEDVVMSPVARNEDYQDSDIVGYFLDYAPANTFTDPRLIDIYDKLGKGLMNVKEANVAFAALQFPEKGLPSFDDEGIVSNPETGEVITVDIYGQDTPLSINQWRDQSTQESLYSWSGIYFSKYKGGEVTAEDYRNVYWAPTRSLTDYTACRNRDLIYANYSAEQQKEVDYDSENIDGDSPFNFGTQVYIPNDIVNKDVINQKGINQTFPTPDFKIFYASYLSALLNDVNYKRVERIKDVTLGGPITTYPNVSVIMWIRGLSSEAPLQGDNIFDDLTGKWMDVTPFVKSVNTNVDGNGGNFQIEFSPIMCEAYGPDGWVLRPKTVRNYEKNDIINQQTVSVAGIHEIDRSAKNKFNPKAGTLRRNSLFFHHVVSPNDLVYIRFETMQMDYEDRKKTAEKFELNNDDIPNRPYDMIGLVDTCLENTTGSTNDITVTVSGRDLVKTIIDDGSYFYATPAHDLTTTFPNGPQDGLVQRLTANGRYPILAEYSYRSIVDSMMFLMNCISGISIVPDSIFTGYGDRRVGRYNFQTKKIAALINTDEVSDGFVQRIKQQWQEGDYGTLLYDPSEQKELLSSNLEKLAEDDPTAVPIPGVNPQGGEGKIYSVQRTGVVVQQNLPLNNSGIWQIIRLQIDENIANRYVADDSIAYPDGSMISQIRKLCQEPYVEFYTDTYYDQFFFIIRQPPFTGKHLRSLINKDIGQNDLKVVLNEWKSDPRKDSGESGATNSTEGKSNKKIKQKKKEKTIKKSKERRFIPKWIQGRIELGEVDVVPNPDSEYLIKISDQEVFTDSLQFNQNPVYSIYEYTPSNILLTNETFVLPLEEYAKVYGACRLAMPSQYVTYESTSQFNSDKSINYAAKQVADDLVFLIESNSYLPFTRSGTIELTGDRRIKRGMWIHYLPTDELFYVTSVKQSYVTGATMQRRTTLEVERGMVKNFVKGQFVDIGGEDVFVSYFDLVKLDLVQNVFYEYLNNPKKNNEFREQISKEGAVNKLVFEFFLLRRQFRQNINIRG